MSRKDYVILAQAIASIRNMKRFADDSAQEAIGAVVDEMCRALACDNPRFNRSRFLSACGID